MLPELLEHVQGDDQYVHGSCAQSRLLLLRRSYLCSAQTVTQVTSATPQALVYTAFKNWNKIKEIKKKKSGRKESKIACHEQKKEWSVSQYLYPKGLARVSINLP